MRAEKDPRLLVGYACHGHKLGRYSRITPKTKEQTEKLRRKRRPSKIQVSFFWLLLSCSMTTLSMSFCSSLLRLRTKSASRIGSPFYMASFNWDEERRGIQGLLTGHSLWRSERRERRWSSGGDPHHLTTTRTRSHCLLSQIITQKSHLNDPLPDTDVQVLQRSLPQSQTPFLSLSLRTQVLVFSRIKSSTVRKRGRWESNVLLSWNGMNSNQKSI